MSHVDSTWTFEGFASPNFTTVPDEFFDVLAPRLNGGEVKVLLYIIRRTFGFKKERDCISLSQMLNGIVRRDGTRLDHGAGMSKPSLCRALNTLAEKNIIISTRQFDFKGGNVATSYQLNMSGNRSQEERVTEPDTLGKKKRQGGLSHNLTKGLSQNLTKPLVKKRDTQETVNNKQGDNNVNVAENKSRGSPLHELADLQQPTELTALIASDILAALGDAHSTQFYRLVARKVPEEVIRKTLSNLKEGRVQSKGRVFTATMHTYARERQTADRSHELREQREALAYRLQSR